jgi:kojibiose phosphorylase
MDILLGRELISASQIIKQADVLMFLHLLWEAFPANVHEANFRYYEPRCAHGSSLSPAIHAAFAARLGNIDIAERYFRQALGIDLDDTQGRVAGGVHVGALGGLWQAVVFGFAGVSTGPNGVRLKPHLPGQWKSLRFPLHWRGRILRIELQSDPAGCTVYLEKGHRLKVTIGEESRTIERHQRWEVTQGRAPREEGAL